MATVTAILGRQIPHYSETEPALGDRFVGYRWRETTGGDTDPLYSWEWEWDGTYWLSNNLFSFIKDSNYGTYEARGSILPGLDLYFTEGIMSARWASVPATNDASNYYTENIFIVDADNGGRNNPAPIDSSGYDPGNDQYMNNRVTLNTHYVTESVVTQVSFQSLTFGNPTGFNSGIYLTAQWWYRYARK